MAHPVITHLLCLTWRATAPAVQTRVGMDLLTASAGVPMWRADSNHIKTMTHAWSWLLVTKLLEVVIQNHLSNAHPLSLSLAMTEKV